VSGRTQRARFVIGSLIAHAALFGVAALRYSPPARVLSQRAESAAATEIELAPEAASTPLVAEPARRDSELRLEPREGRPGRSTPRITPIAPLAVSEPDPETALGVGAEPAEPSAPAASAAPAGPRLSLADLGVEGPSPFLDRGDPARQRAAKAEAVKRRLDRALAQGLTDADRERGLGAGGPVVRALEASVYASTAPLNGEASMVFVIDAGGKLLSAPLGNATGDRRAWLRVAQQTAKSLSGMASLERRQGVKLTVAVTSHLELPSGADPGLEISAQGVPLKKGDGPRSTRLDLSIFPFPAATLAGDPADIGARPRRMVHAHVVSEELL